MPYQQKNPVINPFISGTILFLTLCFAVAISERQKISTVLSDFQSSFNVTVHSFLNQTALSRLMPSSPVPSSNPNGPKYSLNMKRDETIPFIKDGKPWKKFRNYLYGYEVSLPEKWSIRESNTMTDGKQKPAVDIVSQTNYHLPFLNNQGAYYFFELIIDPQNQDGRKIKSENEQWTKEKSRYPEPERLTNLSTTEIQSTDEYKVEQQIISNAQYIYSLDDAKSFVQSITKPQPVVVFPPKSESMNTWKTFKDSAAQFSLRHPSAWSFNQLYEPDGSVGKYGAPIKLIKYLLITIVPDYYLESYLAIFKSNLQPREYIKNFVDDTDASVNENDYKEYKIGEDTWSSFKYPSKTDIGEQVYRYIIYHKGKIFDFRIVTGSQTKTQDDAPIILKTSSAISDFENMVKNITFQDR